MKKAVFTIATALAATIATAQTLTVDLNKRGADVSPTMYGIFFEEINHAGDGGLYAEMLQNRGFEEHVLPTGMTYRDGKVYGPALPHYGKNAVEPWTADWNMEAKRMQGWRVEGGKAEVVLAEHPLHVNTPHALRLMVDGKVTLVNEGYWGVAAKKGEKYDLRFYSLTPQQTHPQPLPAREGSGYSATAILRNEQGEACGQASFDLIADGEWHEYTATITATETFSKGTFALQFDKVSTPLPHREGPVVGLLVDYVSLFPQATFKNRKNGLRKDIAETLAALHPQFMRWPGGCIVEGACYENRVRWKETLGDPMTRRGEWDLWGYRSTYGLGFHEFLQFCEDLGMKGMFVANAAMSCSYRCGDYSEEQAEIDRCLQDMRDAIEYAIGDPAKNEWARRRAEAGHPAPFPLQYIEIGNENNGDIYKRHLNYMYAKLKAEYPQLTFINTLGGFPWEMDGTEGGDMVDPHWYVDPAFFFLHNNEFDSRQRGQWQVYVGEYACNNRVGSGNMMAALADASFILGMERNGDLVKMASYAPLLTNVNQPNWACNLIHFDTDRVMGRAAYYVQQLMAENRPTYNLGLNRVSGDTITIGTDAPACLQPEKPGDVVRCPLQFFAAGRDEQTGEVIIKVVNADTKPYRTKIQLNGAQAVNSLGKVITLRSQTAEDENTLDEPQRISPQVTVYRKFSKQFTYKFEPLSLTIFRIKATTKNEAQSPLVKNRYKEE